MSSIFTMARPRRRRRGDDHGDDDQNDEPRPERLVGHLVEGDHHDLGGQDEVGADRAGGHLLLGVLADRAVGGRGVAVVSTEAAPNLLGALVAEIGRADHQDRRQQPRHELTEQQRGGQDEHQLVAQGSDRDPLDDRQLALGGDAVHVLRRHRGVVDDDSGRLGGRASGGGADVVDRCGREPGQSGNVVEEPEQTSAHRVSVMATRLPGGLLYAHFSPAAAALSGRAGTGSARPRRDRIASHPPTRGNRPGRSPGSSAHREWRHRPPTSAFGQQVENLSWRHRIRGRR